MRLILTAAAIMLGGVLPALADEAAPAAGSSVNVSLTPRVWYILNNTIAGPSDLSKAAHADSTDMPLYGLTGEISLARLPGWSLLVSGYYGETNNSSAVNIGYYFHDSQYSNNPVSSLSGNIKNEYSRYDVEALARYRWDSAWSLVAGVRTMHYDEKSDGSLKPWTLEGTSDRYPYSPRVVSSHATADYYLAELGAVYAHSLTESGTIFGGSTLGLGVVDLTSDVTLTEWGSIQSLNQAMEKFFAQPTGSHLAATLDLNIGYQYAVTSGVSLYARYRAIVSYVDVSGDSVNVAHGPEAGVTVRF